MDRTNATLTALRRILKATELHGREVAQSVGLTAVQLRVLKLADEAEGPTAKSLAGQMRVTQATVTALLDKLAVQGMIERHVCKTDRRQKNIFLTPLGLQTLEEAPDPMQRDFSHRFNKLADWEQAMLLAASERIASLLDAEELDAAPILATGEIDGELDD
jgi:DNA-binding MarR family transcriptional regulator